MLIINGKLLLEDVFDYHDLRIEDGKIAEILPFRSGCKDSEIYDAQGSIVIPGMIDLEVHGALGYDMSDACDEAYDTISNYLIRHGVTSFIGAIDSFDESVLEEAYTAAGEWMSREHKGADMIGLQMRGPFLNPEVPGAQNPKYFRKPDPALYNKLQKLSGGKIKIVNVSPELEGATPFIREVSKTATIALSNSNADYDTARMGYTWSNGWCGDLLWDMPNFSVDEPGMIGAAIDGASCVTIRFDNDRFVHPAMLRMVYRNFWERLCLVSGMTAFTGLPGGSYEIEDHIVTKKNDSVTFEDGRDAGSVLALDSCQQAVLGMGSVPIPVVFRSATRTAAEMLGVYDEIGSITPGKRADLAILDLHSHGVQAVIKNGVFVYNERKNYD